MQEGEIYSGGFVYTPKADYADGLQVGDDIDLSQTYYVNVGTESAPDFREVTITKDTYYTQELNDGAAHNDRVQKVQRSDGNRVGYFGDASPVSGWTPITGDGLYYMKDAESAAVHNNFVLVQSENGTLTHDAYSNKLIAAKSGNPSDGMIVGPGESIGGWNSGDSDVIVVDTNGVEHTVKYANKGSTFHYNMFIYYVDGNGDIVYLTQGANESDGDSKYNYEREGVGKYYYTYNNTLGSYGGKGYYTGTYYRANEHQGKVALFINDGGTTRYLGLNGVDNRTDAIHDHQVVYTGPLYRLQTLQRATYFTYAGGTPVESHLKDDVLTNLQLYTRRVSGEAEIVDNDPDDVAGGGDFGVLVDTTNNFKGNLFIQKKLYRDDATGTYNIKLESWATGNMSQSGGGEPTDIVLVVDLSNSMWQSDTKDLTDTDGSAMYRSTAVIRAISSFIDTLHEADPNGENYRLSIVSFSGEPNKDGYGGWVFLFDGPNHYYKTSDINSHANASLKPVDNAGVTALKQSINTTEFKEPKGDNTYPANGLDLAKIVLNKRTTHTDRPATVIMFTDGVPGTGTGRGYSKYADPAIESAYDLKHNYDATIYTVGLFNFNDENLMGHSRASASEYMGTIIDPGTYSVKEYMEAVSSKYPNAQTEVIPGYATPSGEQAARRPCNLTPVNTDQQYYFKVDTSHGSVGIQALLDAFGSIATTIAVTDVPVTTDSILRDTINQDDFALPAYVASGENATVKTSVVPAAAINSRKQIEWDYDHEAEAAGVTVTPDRITNMDGGFLKGVDVKGYDYQANFSAPAGEGKPAQTGSKLVVRIYGLMPKHGGDVYSNSEAGILNREDAASPYEMYLPVESPFDFIDSRSYVVDYNAKMEFAENGYLASSSDNYVTNITGRTSLAGVNGNFAKSNGAVSYQLNSKTIINGSDNFKNYSFVGTDSGFVFGQYYDATSRAESGKTVLPQIQTLQRVNGEDPSMQTVAKAWQVVNMVPASSVYYDDDFASAAKVVPVGDGSGYNSGLDVTAPTTAETKGKHQFVFTGTGIDIYCTTQDSSGTVKAKLDGENLVTMNNYAITTRYNVPTISYRDFGYGQHVVELTVLGSSNYKIDGVRIYGTNFDNQDIYDGTTEKNAVYLNLRDMLLEPADGSDKVEIPDTPAETSLQDIQFSQVLFVDDFNKYVMQKPVVGDDGKQLFDDEGNPRTTNVYDKEYDAYTAISPKNEIYLDGGQSIVLALTPDALTKNLWIGVSAPVDGEGSVSIGSGNTVSVNTLDQYYPIPADKITVSQNGVGTVTITNAGAEGSTISVTNLKLADKLPADGGTMNSLNLTQIESNELPQKVFAKMTMRSVKIAANDGVDPDAPAEVTDPEPTENPQQPSISEVVQQIISHFVEMLFRSIARMFGH